MLRAALTTIVSKGGSGLRRLPTAMETRNAWSAYLLHASSFSASATAPGKDDLDDLFADEPADEQPPPRSAGAQQQRPTGGAAAARRDVSAQANRRRAGPSLNRVKLIGGVMADPIRRFTRAGSEFASFRVITNRVAIRAGEEFEESESHFVTAFGANANFVMDHVKRGTRVCVIGSAHYEQRDDGRALSVHAETVMPFKRPIFGGDDGGGDDRGSRARGGADLD